MVTEPVLQNRQPVAAPTHSALDLLRVMDIIESMEDDWLWRAATPEGRLKLLREHGLSA